MQFTVGVNITIGDIEVSFPGLMHAKLNNAQCKLHNEFTECHIPSGRQCHVLFFNV